MTTNKFAESLREETNYTNTENDCLTHKSSLSAVLDFFSLGGALRQREEQDIVQLFVDAFGEDKLLTMKVLFYLRDVRGGQGERRTFRTVLKYLGDAHPEIVWKNIENIPFYGRWDDVFSLVGTKSEKNVLQFVKEQLEKDIKSEHPSLLAKWIKNDVRKTVRSYLKMNSEVFRKTVSELRRKIKIVESLMCAKEWENIEYDKITSRSMFVYKKAFRKHDRERYDKYIEDVKSKKKTINAATLYPYDIIRKIYNVHYSADVETLNVLWDAIPDYTSSENAIVLADTSYSMVSNNNSLPIYVSISLAIYFAERNKGAFGGYFMGFSGKPMLYKINGTNIYEKMMSVRKSETHYENTNLIACFKLILETAIKNSVPEDEMPRKLYIVSDMEFDRARSDNSKTAFGEIDRMYKEIGYTRPTIVFWNVNARQNQSAVTKDQNDTILVSGSSPSIFSSVIEGKDFTPLSTMVETLNSERYNRVII